MGQFDTSNINYDSLRGMSEDEALDWDSTFNRADAMSTGVLTPLPEGEYDFVVDDVERGHYPGGKKLPPCPKASITLKVTDANGKVHKVFNSIFLCKSTEWKIADFFESIGLIGPDGEINMADWNKVIGRSGRVRVKQRTYTTDDGVKKVTNDVDAYLPKQADPNVIGGTEVLPF